MPEQWARENGAPGSGGHAGGVKGPEDLGSVLDVGLKGRVDGRVRETRVRERKVFVEEGSVRGEGGSHTPSWWDPAAPERADPSCLSPVCAVARGTRGQTRMVGVLHLSNLKNELCLVTRWAEALRLNRPFIHSWVPRV